MPDLSPFVRSRVGNIRQLFQMVVNAPIALERSTLGAQATQYMAQYISIHLCSTREHFFIVTAVVVVFKSGVRHQAAMPSKFQETVY